jgi:hypothetical protein
MIKNCNSKNLDIVDMDDQDGRGGYRDDVVVTVGMIG